MPDVQVQGGDRIVHVVCPVCGRRFEEWVEKGQTAIACRNGCGPIAVPTEAKQGD